MPLNFLIVGAGLYGAVCARELTDAGHRCLVIEQRDHIGGNCFTRYHAQADCHEHVYGPHIFHTDIEEVWRYVNRFASFNAFVNRPKVRYKGKLYSFPINLFTLYQLFGVSTPQEARERLAALRIPCPAPDNVEDWCLSQVGREIYETFIRGYTFKQWKKHPKELPAFIVKRVPVRLTFDDNYFTHPHQGIPVGGYTQLFERLLDGVEVRLGVDFLKNRAEWERGFDHVIYTGPIDAFFAYEEGTLEYRSLSFETRLLEVEDFQGNAIVNYTEEEVPHTRVIEHKHFDLSFTRPKTLVTYEFPADWDPSRVGYYPIETERNRRLYDRYRQRADALADRITFGGRLGEYRYYDMDKVIASALTGVSRWTVR